MQIAKALLVLTPKEEAILRMKYGVDKGQSHTLKEIADIFGLTRERISQIHHKAIRKLWAHLEALAEKIDA